MIDAGVVKLEERFKLVYSGVSKVAPSLFFSLAIITKVSSFSPWLSQRPLLCSWQHFYFPSRVIGEEDNPINIFLKRAYGKIFELSAFILSLFLLPIFSLLILRKIPSEFMPKLNEGAILYMPSTLPGIPLDEGVEVLRKQD